MGARWTRVDRSSPGSVLGRNLSNPVSSVISGPDYRQSVRGADRLRAPRLYLRQIRLPGSAGPTSRRTRIGEDSTRPSTASPRDAQRTLTDTELQVPRSVSRRSGLFHTGRRTDVSRRRGKEPVDRLRHAPALSAPPSETVAQLSVDERFRVSNTGRGCRPPESITEASCRSIAALAAPSTRQTVVAHDGLRPGRSPL